MCLPIILVRDHIKFLCTVERTKQADMNSDTIQDRIAKVVLDEEKKHKDDPNFQDAIANYMKMKELGLIIPQKYNIPPLDTVGKRRHIANAQK